MKHSPVPPQRISRHSPNLAGTSLGQPPRPVAAGGCQYRRAASSLQALLNFQRQPDDELAATIETFTVSFGGSTMPFSNGLDERQADTESLRMERTDANLHVRVEHPRHYIWRNANSLVANAHYRGFSL